jgi:glycosyltransferase involved in cell wall biosynthesis
MKETLQYSIVIPVYNSEATLEELHNRICSVFKSITDEFEVIFVDDGSYDKSWQKLKELCKQDAKVKVIQLMRNFGQHNALMCGFHFVEGEYVITMDDDLQSPPEEIPKLINKIKEGYDLAYGEYESKKHNLFRNFGSSLVQYVYKRIFNVKGGFTAFRIVEKKLIRSILTYKKNYVFIDGLLAWNSKNIGHVSVQHNEREYGKSSYGLKKLLTLSLNLVTNFSIVPLQIASLLGLFFALFGFGTACYFFLKKLFFGIPVEGYTSLIIAVTIFAGIQLMTLGLIGEYLGRVHLNINNKPQYEIREHIL